MVEAGKQKVLLDQICAYAKANTKFLLPDCGLQIQVISGETEGLYGWIALNYLLGSFDHKDKHDHGKGHHTYGFLDMGGASSQIAFAPNSTEAELHGDALQLLRMRNIGGEAMEYKVFSNTWLGYGVNEARKEYIKRLIASEKEEAVEITDPCLPKGLMTTIEGTEIQDGILDPNWKGKRLIGSGKLEECLKNVHPLLEKNGPCKDAPCLLTGDNVPHIDYDVNHFLGVSEYWHTTHDIFEIDSSRKAYDLATYQKRVLDFCSMEWNSIEKSVDGKKWDKNVDEQRAMETCFKASWVINILHDGIGIPRVGIEGDFSKDKDAFLGAFKPIDKIDDVEVSWTLGRILLYATALIPAVTTKDKPVALPVGFGPSLFAETSASPKDFSYGWPLAIPGTSGSIRSAVSGHPIAAFIVLILILLFALYITGRGRYLRRIKDLFGALTGSRKKRWLAGNEGIVSYERAAEFELDEMDSEEEIDTPRKASHLSVDTGLSRSGSREVLAGTSAEVGEGISRARSPRLR